jgi:UDP-2-acetamido-2-deoxy-ribo-hexuluronate aminotransferase
VGPGDEVITTPFTFIATAEVIALVGATPVFVDVEPDTLTLDPAQLEQAITPRTRAILPVSLFGHCADFDRINAIAAAHGIPCMEDACQSLGSAAPGGRRSGSLAAASAVSFFPAKPLGCYGDGGMVFTDDETLDKTLRVLREHGQTARYNHALVGINGRLDTLQAAILLAKLAHFEDEIAARQRIAAYYMTRLQEAVGDRVRLPVVRDGYLSVFSQFTIRVANRDQVQQGLTGLGIPTAVHYPIPLHRQPVFAERTHYAATAFPVASQAAHEVLSLPMHPFLTPEQQDQVVDALARVLVG